ncbi:hypothetical protein, partial [Micromonospora sp. NPDC049662]|uniref:hypothetical protein n=1 Tax=Micromonospora sp. NPDC049662 TaxID=3155397 RepID=UPI0034301A88
DVAALRLDDEASRDVAVRLARESVVLLHNTGRRPPAAGGWQPVAGAWSPVRWAVDSVRADH